MKIINNIYFLYKILSKISLRIIFRNSNNYCLVNNYGLPLDCIEEYLFLYPEYKSAFNDCLVQKDKIKLTSKSKIINSFNYNIDHNDIKYQNYNLYIIGNDIKNVVFQLFKTAEYLIEKYNFKKITYRPHPRGNFDLSNINIGEVIIQKDSNQYVEVDCNHVILASYTSLASYFINNQFKVFFCKKSLLLELETHRRVDKYLQIYRKMYSKEKVKII